GSGHFCSATVIGPRKVLTARHCTEGTRLHEAVVMTGSDDPAARPGRRVTIARAWVSALIRDEGALFTLREPGDVAVLETTADLDVPALPLSSAGVELPGGEPVTAYGYGRASWVRLPPRETALLRRARMSLYSQSQCDESNLAPAAWFLCGGPAEGQPGAGVVAMGDSGGTLVRQGAAGPELLGVSSTGTDGPLRDRVSGFASVAALRGFIDDPASGVELPRPVGAARVVGRARVGERLRCVARWTPRPERVEVVWVLRTGRAERAFGPKAATVRLPRAARGTRVSCLATGWSGKLNGAEGRRSPQTAVVR
ncbi:MAG TPA: trypsin-like serine protease, partial [Conexibacter sp.]|nr:trypsin-like serine protease [Conexibacter sp.]